MRAKSDSRETIGLLLIAILIFSCAKKPTEPQRPNDEEKVEPATARIVFLARGGKDSTHVYIIDDNGQNLQKLFSHNNRTGDIQVSPEGDRAVFFVDLGVPPPVSNNQLFTLSLQSGDVVQLTDFVTGICWEPQWIPNSEEICFVFLSYLCWIQLFAVRTDGAGSRRITWGDSVSHRLPRVSPDGKKIVFEKHLTPQKIAIINVDGTNEKVFDNTPSEDRYPRWSSDGKKIVFVDDFGLCVMDQNGENYTVVHSTDRGLIPFDVSKSDMIAFNTYSGVQTIGIDGRGLELLTPKRARGSPILWSHDESKIAFITDLDEDGQNEICTIKADGTDFKRVTPKSIKIIEDFGLKVFDWAPLGQ